MGHLEQERPYFRDDYKGRNVQGRVKYMRIFSLGRKLSNEMSKLFTEGWGGKKPQSKKDTKLQRSESIVGRLSRRHLVHVVKIRC